MTGKRSSLESRSELISRCIDVCTMLDELLHYIHVAPSGGKVESRSVVVVPLAKIHDFQDLGIVQELGKPEAAYYKQG